MRLGPLNLKILEASLTQHVPTWLCHPYPYQNSSFCTWAWCGPFLRMGCIPLPREGHFPPSSLSANTPKVLKQRGANFISTLCSSFPRQPRPTPWKCPLAWPLPSLRSVPQPRSMWNLPPLQLRATHPWKTSPWGQQ